MPHKKILKRLAAPLLGQTPSERKRDLERGKAARAAKASKMKKASQRKK